MKSTFEFEWESGDITQLKVEDNRILIEGVTMTKEEAEYFLVQLQGAIDDLDGDGEDLDEESANEAYARGCQDGYTEGYIDAEDEFACDCGEEDEDGDA